MIIAPNIGLIPAQHMVPSPALIAYAGLLALPGSGIERAVSQELDENPALVADDVPPAASGADPGAASIAGFDIAVSRLGIRRGTADGEQTEPERSARESWTETLLRELRCELPAKDRGLAALVVGSLDERGFLDQDVPTLARIGGVDPGRLGTVVRALQDIGPPGVGARDARDSLLLQLDRLEAGGDVQPVARAILTSHMEALAYGRLSAIAAALGVEPTLVLEARAFIRTELRPYPCLHLPGSIASDPEDPGYVRPDVAIFESTDQPGSFEVEVLEASRIRLRVDPIYRSAAFQEDGKSIAELVRRADFFLARLRERWTTLRRITVLVADREREFLRGGPGEHVPLTRATVAAALGLHQSTISRATAGKYVQLPSMQVIAFAELFDGALGARTALRQIIEAELRPLSDAELCDRMRRAGHRVARRTVAKYRDHLGILPSTAR